MTKRISEYWIYQFVGWGLYVFINAFFAATFEKNLSTNWAWRLLVFVTLGLIFSHLMRMVIHRSHVMLKPLQKQLIGFVVITLVFAFATGIFETGFRDLINLKGKLEVGMDNTKLGMLNAFYWFIFFFIWNCIYFIYHYVEKNQKQQIDTLKLEGLVKELELKTIKAHINPHFIFNALNSIRALVDENPVRARTAVTELSNILRSSMQAEKVETVLFEKELGIVKDYLALEYIRFEDRLKIEYDIDEETLGLPVPPMMLQTLVENGIKHGISKQVEGGIIRVTSRFYQNFHELKVQNSGFLNSSPNLDGFGLVSTQNRLQMMYGSQSDFQINETKDRMVEARIRMPLGVQLV
ncbi:MAG: histidine kinase [Chitinophagaceae bacterium]